LVFYFPFLRVLHDPAQKIFEHHFETAKGELRETYQQKENKTNTRRTLQLRWMGGVDTKQKV